MNRTLDSLPPGRWLHRILQRSLCFTDVDVPLCRGHRELDGLRIAFLSDIHAGSYMNEDDLCRIFTKVADRKPDLVCLGGDLINTRDREILYYRKALPILNPPLGIFAVPGNHDYFHGEDLGLWESFLKELGVTVLINRGVRVTRGGGEFWLAGVDDMTEGQTDLLAALQGARPDEPVLLASHHPDMFVEAAQVGIDLTMAGHTHGGQVKLFGRAVVTHSQFGYLSGMFNRGDSRLYVGRGVGATLLPIRIGAPPEVPIFRLRITATKDQNPGPVHS